MKILMVTWEFPPYKVGGIASHCYDLSKALTKQGHELHVITYGEENKTEEVNDISVHRVKTGFAPDVTSWSMMLNHQIQKRAIKLQKEEKFELIHGHDWMSVPASIALKKTFKLPMVFTIHSTEYGRVGIHSSMAKMINDLEWYGTYEANQVITVGKDFKEEVKSLFYVPDEKIKYIPNGVELEKFSKAENIRHEFVSDWEKMVLFVGRLCHQKGIEPLINSIPSIIHEHPEMKFVVVGDGGGMNYYRSLAHQRGVGHKTYFTGYVPEETLVNLYNSADVTVMPSIYEPFGIVALESMAAQTPVVGSRVGGLKEIIIHEWCGLHVYPGDPNSIKWGLTNALRDIGWCDWMGKNGRKRVEKDYNWELIAKWTTGVYGIALGLWS